MEHPIIGFHRDEHGDWIADLACGHGQHVRHNPPWSHRPWVMIREQREQRLGQRLDCRRCEEPEPADTPGDGAGIRRDGSEERA